MCKRRIRGPSADEGVTIVEQGSPVERLICFHAWIDVVEVTAS